MAKFATLFIVAVAWQGAFSSSANLEVQRRQADEMKNRMLTMSADLTNVIQETEVDTNMGRRLMTLAANDFAYALEMVFYRMQQMAQIMEGDKKRVLQGMAGSISDMIHVMQQAMNAEPTQMQTQMRSSIEKMPEMAKKLAQLIQQSQEDRLSNEMKQAMSILMAALQKMKMQMVLRTKSLQEMNTEMEQMINQMPTLIQNIKPRDEQTAVDLTHLMQMLCRMMRMMVNRMEKMAVVMEGEVKQTMLQVANKMIERCAELEQASNSVAEPQEKISKMMDMLMPVMRDMAAQVQRMMQVAQAHSQDQEMDAMMKIMMMDAMAACKMMQVMLEMIAMNN